MRRFVGGPGCLPTPVALALIPNTCATTAHSWRERGATRNPRALPARHNLSPRIGHRREWDPSRTWPILPHQGPPAGFDNKSEAGPKLSLSQSADGTIPSWPDDTDTDILAIAAARPQPSSPNTISASSVSLGTTRDHDDAVVATRYLEARHARLEKMRRPSAEKPFPISTSSEIPPGSKCSGKSRPDNKQEDNTLRSTQTGVLRDRHCA